jgi:hypothetical protein
MLQARSAEQAAKVAASAQRVQELGTRLALEAATPPGTAPGNSPFTAGGSTPMASSTVPSPFKRSRPAEEEDEAMGRGDSLPSGPAATDNAGILIAALGGSVSSDLAPAALAAAASDRLPLACCALDD